MAWLYLVIAGLFEIQWAITMKYTEGFSRLWPSVLCIAGMAASVWFLAQAYRTIPIGTAYAIWTGIGAVGTALLGMVLFNESRELARLVCIALVVVGILGLKFFSGDTAV